MLDTQDFQSLGKLIEEKLEEKLEPIRKSLGVLQKNGVTMQKDVKIIKRNSKFVVSFLNEEDIALKIRVERIEEVLHLSKIS